VLLVIFMVAAPMLPSGTVELPSVGKAATPPAAPLEVTVLADGGLTVQDRASNAPAKTVSRSELAQAITAAREKDADKPVLIAGDKAVRYEAVLQVMDELQKQQVKRIGLLVHPTGR
jgi:biopolymer transport protein TolR